MLTRFIARASCAEYIRHQNQISLAFFSPTTRARYAVPKPALADFDSEAEKAEGLGDLREQFPGFDQKTKMLSIRVMRDEWPAQRACAGYDLSRETSVRGPWQVGDAVKDYGNGGTQACAETAKLVVDAIVAARANARQPAL